MSESVGVFHVLSEVVFARCAIAMMVRECIDTPSPLAFFTLAHACLGSCFYT
jgi:hypothetical protein